MNKDDFPKLVASMKQYHKVTENLMAAEVQFNHLKNLRNNLVEEIGTLIGVNASCLTDDGIVHRANAEVGAAVITAYDAATNVINLLFKKKDK